MSPASCTRKNGDTTDQLTQRKSKFGLAASCFLISPRADVDGSRSRCNPDFHTVLESCGKVTGATCGSPGYESYV
jgi:hypothetical protein